MKRKDIMINVLGDDFENHESYDELKTAIDEIENKVNDVLIELQSSNEDKAEDAEAIASKLSDDLY